MKWLWITRRYVPDHIISNGLSLNKCSFDVTVKLVLIISALNLPVTVLNRGRLGAHPLMGSWEGTSSSTAQSLQRSQSEIATYFFLYKRILFLRPGVNIFILVRILA